jgi:hypothetical protein
VIARDILAFVSRDWERVRQAKDHYWSERIARFGPAEAFRIGDDLRCQAILLNPGWPDAAERHRDLRAHVRLARRLRRASPARRA